MFIKPLLTAHSLRVSDEGTFCHWPTRLVRQLLWDNYSPAHHLVRCVRAVTLVAHRMVEPVWLVLALVFTSAAVQAQVAQAVDVKLLRPFVQDGIYAPVAQASEFVMASPTRGLQWLEDDGDVLASVQGNFQGLAVLNHPREHEHFLVATLDVEQGIPVVFRFDMAEREFTEWMTLDKPAAAVKDLCLGLDDFGNVSLYLLFGRKGAEQWLIGDGRGNAQKEQLRQLLLSPNATACAVDPISDSLLIAEQGVGLWRYQAQAESGIDRSIVDIVAPFGNLDWSPAQVVAIPAGLVVPRPASDELWFYQYRNERWELTRKLEVSDISPTARVRGAFDPSQNRVRVVVSDSYNRKALYLDFPWRAPASSSGSPAVTLTADAQTEPMAAFGESADDPAIWVNRKDPFNSRILGTDKQQGLVVYDLAGRRVQQFNSGKLNNVDVRYDLQLDGSKLDIAIATNRDRNTLSVYPINPETGELSYGGEISTALQNINGLCLYQPDEADLYAFANDIYGNFHQFQIKRSGKKFIGQLVRQFALTSRPEACVADDKRKRLFVSEENYAVWAIKASPQEATDLQLVIKKNRDLQPDIEGLALYQGEKDGYLIVSSQGNNRYLIAQAQPPYATRGVFQLDLDIGNKIDGVSGTGGLAVTSADLGGMYRRGLLVVQDEHNVMPAQPQNFKYVSWHKVAVALGLE